MCGGLEKKKKHYYKFTMEFHSVPQAWDFVSLR